MKIWFCRSNDLGGFLIRLCTFSQWNHVAIEIDGVIYEAVTSAGVRKMSAYGYDQRWDAAEAVEVPLTDKQGALDFLEEQVGKPYDWCGIIALPFRKSWQDPEAWFCSELGAKVANAYTAYHIARVRSWRIKPQDLWVALP